jgi:hypothetical protein
MFKKYLDPKRNIYGGSQSENSEININIENKNILHMSGYHVYDYDKSKSNHIILKNYKQIKQLEYLLNIDYSNCDSLLDLGCANGAISLYLYFEKKIKNIFLVDHDIQYTKNLEKLKEFDNNLNITIITSQFKNYDKSTDYVLALSLIHWLYSATDSYGCLFEIVKKLKSLTNKCLIIEWIDNTDSVFEILGHIDMNKSIHKTEYNKKNFLEALNTNFTKIEYLGNTTLTRELFKCKI